MALEMIKAIQEHRERYLDLFQDKSLACIDLETTGLDGSKPLEQITQIFVQEVGGEEMHLSPIKLLAANVERLKEEMAREEPLDDTSLHWVLALNQHSPEFKFKKDIPGTPEEETKGAVLIGEDQDGEDLYREFNIPQKLTEEELDRLLERQAEYLTEEQALRSLAEWWDSRKNDVCVFGHNVLTFDVPFIRNRGNLYGLSYAEVPLIDTLWLNRLLIIPLLVTIKRSLPVGDKITGWYNGLHVHGKKFLSSLQTLRQVFGLGGEEGAHTAKEDVRVTIALLKFQRWFLENLSPPVKEDHLLYDLFIDIMDETLTYYKKYL